METTARRTPPGRTLSCAPALHRPVRRPDPARRRRRPGGRRRLAAVARAPPGRVHDREGRPVEGGPEGPLAGPGRGGAQFPGRRRRARLPAHQGEGQGRRAGPGVRREDRQAEVGAELRQAASSRPSSATARGPRRASTTARCTRSASPGRWPAGTPPPASRSGGPTSSPTPRRTTCSSACRRRRSSSATTSSSRAAAGRARGSRRTTGRPASWRGRPATTPASYAAPVLFGKEIVVLTAANLMSVSLDGKVNWDVPVQGPAQREFDHPGQGRRPVHGRVGDGRGGRRPGGRQDPGGGLEEHPAHLLLLHPGRRSARGTCSWSAGRRR